MACDVNPYRNLSAEISPIDFEKFCMETLKAYAQRENLTGFSIEHNQIVNAHDGAYQIDAIGGFFALGTKIKLIVECKKYSRPIEREKVSVLFGKQQSLGANKSIFMSTSGFQSGAVQYAKEHGIALIQIIDESVKYIQDSTNMDILAIQALIRKQLPKFFALQWDCEAGYPYEEIFPTKEMYRKARESVKEQIEC